ncbi:MAG: peptidoglycan-binding domain-containing protein, partial [Enhydrobacter sp.]
MMRWPLVVAILAVIPLSALGQSADQVERCFQNPAGCTSGGGGQAAPPASAPPVTASRPAAPPDYTTVLQSPEPDRRKLQESLRTFDKYNGPIDGDLKSEASTKAIAEWQKSHGYTQVGKLTPTEAVTLNNEAAKAPIRRLDPSTQTAAPPPPPSNADLLKALQAKRAAARKAAEPKAEAAMQS